MSAPGLLRDTRTLAVVAWLAHAVTAAAQLTCNSLRCEGLDDPLAVREPHPRLSWICASDQRSQRQSAYRVLVASSPEQLAADRGDLWDTGRVSADWSPGIEYLGSPLESRQACYWKVMTWDAQARPGPWSTPARFEMALLHPDDWSARWIDARARPPEVVITGATYYAEDGSARRDVTAVVAAMVASARPIVASNDALGGDPAVNVRKRLELSYVSRGTPHHADVAENQTIDLEGPGLPLLRRSFNVPDSPIVRARLYATALGLYELHLNAQRVGDHHLAPGWTDYRRRVHYQVYDVTELVHTGDNALCAVVGPGWYSGRAGLFHIRQFYGDRPALLAQLEITHADGTTTIVTTDDHWRRHDGPDLAADLMDGQTRDARLDIPGWMLPGFDDSPWEPVQTRQESRTLEAQPDRPVRVLAQLPARSVTQPAPGRWTFDLGQNMVGVVRLAVHAPAGTAITIRHAEMLNPDGTIYTANLRGAAATDRYTCRGPSPAQPEADEVWQPAFTFHGFRYVEITGLPQSVTPTTAMVTGVVLGSELPARGTFTCSDPALNQLQSNIVWGLRGNYLSIPTDCPQRDERMGWTADTQVFAPTALLNADAALFLSKWLTDLRDAQQDDGAYPDVAPNTRGLSAGVPGWADAGCVVPWAIYQSEGDTRVLERHVESMIRWVEWCRAHSTALIRDRDRGNDYGDWLAIGSSTPKDLIGTAYFAHSTDLLARTLRVLGRDDEAARYEDLFQQIRRAFAARYIAPDARIAGDSQTAYLMALGFDLVPHDLRQAAAERLVADIRDHDDRLTTGFLGVGLLLPTLSDLGRDDVAATLLMQDQFPSWLFSVRHGATTIWERWDGWTPATGPHPDDSMNSFNHYALGACGQWLYTGVAGIRPDPARPAFERLDIKPVLVPSLDWAQAGIQSVRGPVATRWSIDDHQLTLRVTIPVGARAHIHIPTPDPASVRERGRDLAHAPAVAATTATGSTLIVEVGSGDYEFTAAAPARPARTAHPP